MNVFVVLILVFSISLFSSTNTKKIRSLNLFQKEFPIYQKHIEKERLREWEKEGNTFVSVSD